MDSGHVRQVAAEVVRARVHRWPCPQYDLGVKLGQLGGGVTGQAGRRSVNRNNLAVPVISAMTTTSLGGSPVSETGWWRPVWTV